MKTNRLGLMIRAHREQHGIRQNFMANKLGCSKSQLSKIETGKHDPKGELTLRILELLIPDISATILKLSTVSKEPNSWRIR